MQAEPECAPQQQMLGALVTIGLVLEIGMAFLGNE